MKKLSMALFLLFMLSLASFAIADDEGSDIQQEISEDQSTSVYDEEGEMPASDSSEDWTLED